MASSTEELLGQAEQLQQSASFFKVKEIGSGKSISLKPSEHKKRSVISTVHADSKKSTEKHETHTVNPGIILNSSEPDFSPDTASGIKLDMGSDEGFERY